MISTDRPIAEARNSRDGLRPQLHRAARRLWPLALMVAVAGAVCAWIGPAPDRVYDRARAEARAGRFDQAEVTLERLARLRAPTQVDRLLRAQVAGARGRTDAALAELGAISDGHPLGPLARLSEGQLEARRGRLRAAEAAFLATLKLAPRSVQARRELVYIYSVQQRLAELDKHLNALSEQGTIDLPHLIHWGMIRHSEWAANVDIGSLEGYVAADPQDHHSRLALAEALRRAGRVTEAVRMIEPLPGSDPGARAFRALMALDRGERAVAEALLADGPTDHPALARLRGQLALARGEYREAAQFFRIALDSAPGDQSLRYNLVIALNAAGESTAAEPLQVAFRRHNDVGKLLIEARTDGLKDETLAYRIGQACADAGRPLEARAWLNLAISRDPLDARALAALHRLDRTVGTAEPPALARP